MFLFRAAGLVLIAVLIAGCQQPQVAQPSTAMEPTSEQAAAALAQSWRATHPGTEVGVVNAVLPARRELSVAGLPADRVQPGNVITILLNGQGTSTVEGVVIDKNPGPSGTRYVQLTYQPLGAAQRDPRLGDLAIWFPGGESVPPAPTQGPETQPTTMPVEPVNLPPATQEAAPAAPQEAMPPSTQPAAAPQTQPAAPETQPAATEPASAAGGPPTTTETPAAPPQEKPPAELNK